MVCTVCIIDSNRLLSVCFKWEARISSCKYRANDGNIGNIKIELSEAALEKRKYRMPIKLCNAYLSDSVIQQRFFINDQPNQNLRTKWKACVFGCSSLYSPTRQDWLQEVWAFALLQTITQITDFPMLNLEFKSKSISNAFNQKIKYLQNMANTFISFPTI